MVRRSLLATLAAFLAAGICFAMLPWTLDASYDWIQHSTSEAAGQAVHGAWLSRAGFLFYGTAVAIGWIPMRPSWSRVASLVFAASMVGVAAFASRDWTGAPYDRTEDFLHSFFATFMGFAFAAAVVLRALERRSGWVLHGVAVAASVILPILMSVLPDAAGLLQRAIFLIAAVWFTREVWGTTPPATP